MLNPSQLENILKFDWFYNFKFQYIFNKFLQCEVSSLYKLIYPLVENMYILKKKDTKFFKLLGFSRNTLGTVILKGFSLMFSNFKF